MAAITSFTQYRTATAASQPGPTSIGLALRALTLTVLIGALLGTSAFELVTIGRMFVGPALNGALFLLTHPSPLFAI